jgi:hypothetical protein
MVFSVFILHVFFRSKQTDVVWGSDLVSGSVFDFLVGSSSCTSFSRRVSYVCWLEEFYFGVFCMAVALHRWSRIHHLLVYKFPKFT